MKIINLDKNFIENEIYFLCNGYRIHKKDYESTLLELGIIGNSSFIVIDKANLIVG